jgi:hypothetical protein
MGKEFEKPIYTASRSISKNIFFGSPPSQAGEIAGMAETT